MTIVIYGHETCHLCPHGKRPDDYCEGCTMGFNMIHDDARDAIREGNMLATQTGVPQAVGYVKGMGWTCYDPRNGAVPTVEPEFLCFALGKIPLPLSETAFDVLLSATAAVA